MPTQVTNYQCPACTGPLHFSGAIGKLECEYCGSSYEVAEIEALYADKNQKAEEAAQAAQAKAAEANSGDSGWDTSRINADWGTDGTGMKAYSCPSCGAELVCDASTAATSCPYCGNPTVVPGQFAGVLKPDYILPFKLSKEDAIKALKSTTPASACYPPPLRTTTILKRFRGSMCPSGCLTGRRKAQ